MRTYKKSAGKWFQNNNPEEERGEGRKTMGVDREKDTKRIKSKTRQANPSRTRGEQNTVNVWRCKGREGCGERKFRSGGGMQ